MQRGRRDLVYGWFDRDLLHTIRGRVASIPPFSFWATPGEVVHREKFIFHPLLDVVYTKARQCLRGGGGS